MSVTQGYTFSQSGTLTLSSPTAYSPQDTGNYILYTVPGYVIYDITGHGGNGGTSNGSIGGGGGGGGGRSVSYPIFLPAGTRHLYRVLPGGAGDLTTEISDNEWTGDAFHSEGGGLNASGGSGGAAGGGSFDRTQNVRQTFSGGRGGNGATSNGAGGGGGSVGTLTANGTAGTAAVTTVPGVGSNGAGNGGSSGVAPGSGTTGCGGGGANAHDGAGGTGGNGRILVTFTSIEDSKQKGILTWSGS